MNVRRRPGPTRAFPALVLLALLAPLVPHAGGQSSGATVQLTALAAGYGPEEWKDEPPLGDLPGGLPLPGGPGTGVGVYANPYADGLPHRGPLPWLGFNATATLEVQAPAGARLPGEVYVTARLRTVGGDIPAKLARQGPTQFTAQFDLDGEAGKDFPAAAPGAARLVVEVYEDIADPTVADRRVATAEFPLQVHAASLDLGGLQVEDEVLGFRDLGPGNTTHLAVQAVRPGDPFHVVADLGAPEAAARVVAWHQGRGLVLAEGRTDAQGRFAAALDTRDILGGNRSGLAVLAAHLDGAGGRLASAPFAVPVTPHRPTVSAFEYEGRDVPGGAVDDLRVRVRDAPAGEDRPARGVLHLLDPQGASLAAVPFDPTSFAPGAAERVARVPAAELPRDVTQYRLVARFDLADGRLYALAHALRGYDVLVDPARAAPFEPGNLTLRVRNLNSNLDPTVDVGLNLTAHLNVTGLPGGGVFRSPVQVPEQGEVRLDVPFRGDVGTYGVRVASTMDELSLARAADVVVAAPPSSLLPGPEPAVVLVGIALLALLHRGRTRA